MNPASTPTSSSPAHPVLGPPEAPYWVQYTGSESQLCKCREGIAGAGGWGGTPATQLPAHTLQPLRDSRDSPKAAWPTEDTVAMVWAHPELPPQQKDQPGQGNAPPASPHLVQQLENPSWCRRSWLFFFFFPSLGITHKQTNASSKEKRDFTPKCINVFQLTLQSIL